MYTIIMITIMIVTTILMMIICVLHMHITYTSQYMLHVYICEERAPQIPEPLESPQALAGRRRTSYGHFSH